MIDTDLIAAWLKLSATQAACGVVQTRSGNIVDP